MLWGYSLYSLPVCGVSFLSISPAFTCLRAGLRGFFAGFGFGVVSDTVSIVVVFAECSDCLSSVTARCHVIRPHVHCALLSHGPGRLHSYQRPVTP